MSIRGAFVWLLDVGDEGALKQARSPDQRRTEHPGEVAENPLYGQAEAIRVLYQQTLVDESQPKPPRPRRGRGVWAAQFLDSLTPSLGHATGAKA
jgi:hypothetical protein